MANQPDYRQLAALATRNPAPSNGALAALRFYADRSASHLVRVVRDGRLKPKPVDASSATASLLQVTGWNALECKQGPTLLDARPDIWAGFTEPQITCGWAHFLQHSHIVARCRAAFDAAWHDPTSRPKLTHVELVGAELGRIDLLLIGSDLHDRRYGLCIEAKFGHVITDAQLPAYEQRLAGNHGICDATGRTLLILAPYLRDDISDQLKKPGNEWRYMSWKQWLIGYENALPPSADDGDFRRFRRTTLHRASQEMGN